jgi:multidrug resistance efflux pump
MARAVRAPVDGRIIRRLAAPGEGVTAGSTPLFWLAPTGPQLVRAQLDEDSVPLVTPGETAEVLADSDPGTVRRATVRQVGLYFGPKPAAPDDPVGRC